MCCIILLQLKHFNRLHGKRFKDTVFYEIYPQSFKDSDGDGIGDINGIVQKLDYIKELGCNALWINPCYDSPFKDAGYDIRDYKKVAPRYGTNEDLFRLFDEAHKKGIRVLLDLVPGHTSEEHPLKARRYRKMSILTVLSGQITASRAHPASLISAVRVNAVPAIF